MNSKKYSLLFAIIAGLLLIGGFTGLAATKITKITPKIAAPPAAPAVAFAEQSQTILAVKAVREAVVSIVVNQKVQIPASETVFVNPQTGEVRREQHPAQEAVKEYGRGSGFIVRQDGLIVTNKHVVNIQNPIITVFTNDGNYYSAEIKGLDALNDVAIIKINGKNLPTVVIGNSDDIEIGQTVLAVGNSLGRYQNTVTKGIVSGIGRSITASTNGGVTETLADTLQTDAAINAGNSGGPLITLDGHVIGINTAIDSAGQSVGFSIPINIVTPIVSSLVRTGRIIHARLGVRFIMITPELKAANNLPAADGAYLAPGPSGEPSVVPGSPAEKAGIKAGDIITAVNNIKLDYKKSLQSVIANLAPGMQVNLKILRNSQTLGVTTTLDEMPQ